MFLFFFKVPATTVSYTYAHTLSLHYALPISVVISGHQRRAAADDLSDRALRQFRAVLADHFGDMAGRGLADGVELVRIFMRFEQEGRSALGHAVYFDEPARPARRSEEHTSELQSLMRISYAVFCLKNKTHPQT